MEPEDMNDVLRRIFGDGDIHNNDGPVMVRSEYRERMARYIVPATTEPVVEEEPLPIRKRREREMAAAHKINPVFARIMERDPHGQTRRARTWLYAATHDPSPATQLVLVRAAIPIIEELRG